jgi:hypothetical protein
LEPDFLELIRNARKKKVEKFRTQLSVFLVCLILSVFIWLLVHLSKEYYYTAEYKLHYTHIPWNMRMISCSDTMLSVTIRLQGYEFFSEQFFRKKSLQTDVSLKSMKMKIGEDEVEGYLITKGIARTIAEQTSYPLEIFSTSPDTLFFTFEKKSIRKMPAPRITPVTIVHPEPDSIKVHRDSIRNPQDKESKNRSSRKKGTS